MPAGRRRAFSWKCSDKCNITEYSGGHQTQGISAPIREQRKWKRNNTDILLRLSRARRYRGSRGRQLTPTNAPSAPLAALLLPRAPKLKFPRSRSSSRCAMRQVSDRDRVRILRASGQRGFDKETSKTTGNEDFWKNLQALLKRKNPRKDGSAKALARLGDGSCPPLTPLSAIRIPFYSEGSRQSTYRPDGERVV
jgi:hypothetical protein